MSALVQTAAPLDVHIYGAPRLLTGVTQHGRLDFTLHESLHGGLQLRGREWLAGALRTVGLRGRGGAAFPVARKFEAVAASRRTEILVNGSESEPVSQKDRTLLIYAPHTVIDGAQVVAHALGTTRMTIIVHDADAADSLRRAISERPDSATVKIVQHDGGFVSGEIRAAIATVNRDAPVPPGRRVLPHVRGVGGAPTFASNAETFAQIGTLARLGATEFSHIGTPAEPGTCLVTVWGDAPHPGVCEVPQGIPIASLLPGAARPVLLGGYHGTWVDDVGELPLIRTGVIARTPEGTCAVPEVVRIAQWLAAESTKRCGPCQFGLPAISNGLAELAAGVPRSDAELLWRRLELVTGRGACAHPDGSVRFIASALNVMADDFAAHAQHGTCGRPHGSFLPLPGGAS